MNIKPIRTAKDHDAALKEISKLMDLNPALGSPKGDRLDVLITLVQAYEAKHFPMELPVPVEAIKFRMEQLGYNQTDLANVVGLKSRASEILNRKRKLSLEMIRQIHDRLNIPTEVLIQAY